MAVHEPTGMVSLYMTHDDPSLAASTTMSGWPSKSELWANKGPDGEPLDMPIDSGVAQAASRAATDTTARRVARRIECSDDWVCSGRGQNPYRAQYTTRPTCRHPFHSARTGILRDS